MYENALNSRILGRKQEGIISRGRTELRCMVGMGEELSKLGIKE